ncbi:MAG: hypothetical protein ACQERK_06775 [Campylobacterota bacterium]
MQLRKFGTLYALIAFFVALALGYSVSIVSIEIEFVTIFITIFIALIVMQFVTMLLVKTYVLDKVLWLKDEVKRFNYTKVEKMPGQQFQNSIVASLADAIYAYQNKNLQKIQTLEKELEEKKDLLRENQYYIEHLESAILKNQANKGEQDAT